MIHDARVLKEDWIPRELHHREGQIQHFSSELKPITHGLGGENILVTGPSGTGKTTISKFVVKQLTKQSFGIRWGYVNCISTSAKSAICHSLVRDAGRGNDLRPEGTPVSMYFDRLREMDDQFVAILDEVDVLDDDTTIHALHEIPNVTLILVCVSEDTLFTDLDSRVVSRLRGAAKVNLTKYNHSELCDILEGRIAAGLQRNSVENDVVDYIADIAAGDARHAIALLRRAVRHIAKRGEDRVAVENVVTVRDEARKEIHERRIDTLGTHQRHLYEIIADAGEISVEDLHGTYEERVSEPKAKSTRRKYLQSLERYDLVESEGLTRGKRYRVIRP
jgi:orc1/cdc6 family replication initiation protein